MKQLLQRISGELRTISDKGLSRRLVLPCGTDLSSNDFLCLANDQRLRDAFSKGIQLEGVGSTGSRLLRGERSAFQDVEAQFAGWKGTERSLYFSSGYQANVGVFQTFPVEGDLIFSDELNHASIIDGMRLSRADRVIFPHRDVKKLRQLISSANCSGQKFLVTESLFSMDGDIAPLDEYAQLCRETNTALIVDEAHAVGAYGPDGSGLISEFGIENDVFVSINTAGKALGVSGAFVAGDQLTIEYLINKCRSFIFSTAPPPAVAYALNEAINIIRSSPELRQKLHSIAQYFNQQMVQNGYPGRETATQIIPVLIGESASAVAAAERLQSEGFDVRAIRPPTVAEGTSRLRVSLNAGLSEVEIDWFVECLQRSLK